MCSAAINSASSCYLDDFVKLFGAIGIALAFAMVVGTIVGVVKRSIEN